jgi:hypothetical protein
MTHSSPVRKDASFRHILHSVVNWLVMTLSVVFGVVGAVAAFFGAALLFTAISALVVVALAVGLVITIGGAWIAARMMGRAHPGRIALSVGAATMLVLALISAVTIFQPRPVLLLPGTPHLFLLVSTTGT